MNIVPKMVIECAGSFRVKTLPGGRVEIEVEEATPVSQTGDIIYDKAGAAKRLGTNPRTIENWMTQKKHPLPYIRNCGHPKFREADIQWWLSQGCSVASRRTSAKLGGIIS